MSKNRATLRVVDGGDRGDPSKSTELSEWFDGIARALRKEGVRVQTALATVEAERGQPDDIRAFRRVAKTLRAELFSLDSLKYETVKALKLEEPPQRVNWDEASGVHAEIARLEERISGLDSERADLEGDLAHAKERAAHLAKGSP
jgi:hypothetical protein